AERHDWKFGAAGCPGRCNSEWLYDLVWYRNNEAGLLHQIGLIMESEWSRAMEEIRYDFEKLLVAKAPIKVMVFQCGGPDFEAKCEALEESMRAFPAAPSEEVYILAGFCHAGYQVRVK